MRNGFPWLGLGLVILAFSASPILAGESTRSSATHRWTSSLGLSYVATSGNSETTSAGLDLDVQHKGTVWDFNGKFTALRASRNGTTSAERTAARGRLRRRLGKTWGVEGGVSAERDVFAGVDLRSILDLGAGATFVLAEGVQLDLGLGTTWTHEELSRVAGRDRWGGLISTDLSWTLSETATFQQSLDVYPSFTQTRAYRVESETALEAAVNRHLAVKLGYEVRYNHIPPEGKHTTDTSTRASLVIRF